MFNAINVLWHDPVGLALVGLALCWIAVGLNFIRKS